QTGKRFDELLLTVTLDARHAEDFAGADAQTDRCAFRSSAREDDVAQDEPVTLRIFRLCWYVLAGHAFDLVPDHHSRDLGGRAVGSNHRPNDLPAPKNCRATADLRDLVELVRDEDCRAATGDELAQDGEQADDFL